MKRIVLFLLLISTFAFGQTSRFERYFRDANGALIGSTIYIVHTVTSDSLELTEVNSTTKPGLYRRSSVPYGMYKVYIDGVKETENIFFGANRQYQFIEAIDSDGDNILDTPNTVVGAAIRDTTLTISKRKATWIDTTIAVSGISNTLVFDISSYSYTNPKVTQIINKKWPIYLTSITSSTLTMWVGYVGKYDSVKTDILIEEQ